MREPRDENRTRHNRSHFRLNLPSYSTSTLTLTTILTASPSSLSRRCIHVHVYRVAARPHIHAAPSFLRAITIRPSHSHSQSIHPASSSSSALPPSSSSAPTSHSGGWAIWSRRPRDPAHAPGVIISPRARPPPDVVASARAGETPPPVPVERDRREGGEVVEGAMDGRVEEDAEEVEAPAAADADADADTPSSSTDYTDTRTTATTVPGSPLSSATSVSASVSKAAEPAPAPAPAASTSASSPSLDAAPATPPPKNCGPLSFDSPLPLPPAPPQQQGPKTETKIGRPPDLFCGAGSGAAQSVGKNHAALRALLRAPATDVIAAAPKSFADASASTAPTTSEKTREERLTPRGLVGQHVLRQRSAAGARVLRAVSSLFAHLHALLGEADGGQDDGGGGEGVLGPAPLVRATGAFLREFIVSVSAKKPVNGGAGGKGKGKVSPAEEQEEEPEAFILTHIYDALKGKKRFDGMRGGHQEDAEEFLGFFLDTLEEELLAVAAVLSPASAPASKRVNATLTAGGTGRAVVEEREEEAPPETEDGRLEVGRKNRTVVTRTVKSAESPITRIFGGRFRSTLRAPGQKDSVIVEDWRSLRLDIQCDGIHTIADTLALISHPQTRILIVALPPILILHVKRFCYDTAVGGVVKVGRRVALGRSSRSRMMSWCRYKLFGVANHFGVSASGGHYTLDVLHLTWFPGSATGTGSEREGWVRIDDELVSDVQLVDTIVSTPIFESLVEQGILLTNYNASLPITCAGNIPYTGRWDIGHRVLREAAPAGPSAGAHDGHVRRSFAASMGEALEMLDRGDQVALDESP
ncbi:hypothetical protein B0H14DRAFT_3864257 [Mycena olivaceomarginata]|nr:hypothetical protein B0H14DRAFT_3864257 [Mycena olivaceomarginata]